MQKHRLLFFFMLTLPLVGLLPLTGCVARDGGKLPLMIIPAKANADTPLAIFVSGDGGWTSFSKDLAATLAANNIPVVALNAREYFWSKKSPEQFTKDISSLAQQYMQEWGKQSFILVGFSFGADVAAFLPERLQPALKARLKLTALLSPSASTDFEVKLMDMAGVSSIKRGYDVLKEIKRLEHQNVVCVFGADEEAGLDPDKVRPLTKVAVLEGRHYFNNNAKKVAETIQKSISR
ncbi:AcvB/VirJ family lysyl-phosphatidylglycerol hydrolase [Pontibacter chitinilyticus]|uniref:AcvB/VirJ family lysyl-phosphatidylglycerol hydrolase n=1 Tax=Pontibacter chitinilyticus TaxID=2674989 RepID=UPI00321A7E2D